MRAEQGKNSVIRVWAGPPPALLRALGSAQCLRGGRQGALCGLAGQWPRLHPVVLTESQGAAPAVQAVIPQDPHAPGHARAPTGTVHFPAQSPVWGEALVGQTHECGLSLLQLHTGGGQDCEGGNCVTWETQQRREVREWTHPHVSIILSSQLDMTEIQSMSHVTHRQWLKIMSWFASSWTTESTLISLKVIYLHYVS